MCRFGEVVLCAVLFPHLKDARPNIPRGLVLGQPVALALQQFHIRAIGRAHHPARGNQQHHLLRVCGDIGRHLRVRLVLAIARAPAKGQARAHKLRRTLQKHRLLERRVQHRTKARLLHHPHHGAVRLPRAGQTLVILLDEVQPGHGHQHAQRPGHMARHIRLHALHRGKRCREGQKHGQQHGVGVAQVAIGEFPHQPATGDSHAIHHKVQPHEPGPGRQPPAPPARQRHGKGRAHARARQYLEHKQAAAHGHHAVHTLAEGLKHHNQPAMHHKARRPKHAAVPKA